MLTEWTAALEYQLAQQSDPVVAEWGRRIGTAIADSREKAYFRRYADYPPYTDKERRLLRRLADGGTGESYTIPEVVFEQNMHPRQGVWGVLMQAREVFLEGCKALKEAAMDRPPEQVEAQIEVIRQILFKTWDHRICWCFLGLLLPFEDEVEGSPRVEWNKEQLGEIGRRAMMGDFMAQDYEPSARVCRIVALVSGVWNWNGFKFIK